MSLISRWMYVWCIMPPPSILSIEKWRKLNSRSPFVVMATFSLLFLKLIFTQFGARSCVAFKAIENVCRRHGSVWFERFTCIPELDILGLCILMPLLHLEPLSVFLSFLLSQEGRCLDVLWTTNLMKWKLSYLHSFYYVRKSVSLIWRKRSGEGNKFGVDLYAYCWTQIWRGTQEQAEKTETVKRIFSITRYIGDFGVWRHERKRDLSLDYWQIFFTLT